MTADDIVLLLSGGVWTPRNLPLLQKTAVSAALKLFSEMPAAVLDAAGHTGKADELTVVALRLAR